jgi:DNA-binding MarR family transcriptional regulator
MSPAHESSASRRSADSRRRSADSRRRSADSRRVDDEAARAPSCDSAENRPRATTCPRDTRRRRGTLGLRPPGRARADSRLSGFRCLGNERPINGPLFRGRGISAGGATGRSNGEPRVGTKRGLRLGMTPVFYGLKRAYYATLGLTRRTLRKMGLTAARMDMLYVIHKNKLSLTYQDSLWRTLGVCPSVVSRMLKRLEAIGYVKREVSTCDTRRRKVTLTTKGRAHILRAIRQFIGWGYAQLALESALAPHYWNSPWKMHVAVSRAEEFLDSVRLGFGDRAKDVYTDGLRDDQLPRATTLVLRWLDSPDLRPRRFT